MITFYPLFDAAEELGDITELFPRGSHALAINAVA